MIYILSLWLLKIIKIILYFTTVKYNIDLIINYFCVSHLFRLKLMLKTQINYLFSIWKSILNKSSCKQKLTAISKKVIITYRQISNYDGLYFIIKDLNIAKGSRFSKLSSTSDSVSEHRFLKIYWNNITLTSIRRTNHSFNFCWCILNNAVSFNFAGSAPS